MAAKGPTYKTDLLKLIFNGTTMADLAENDTTSPATNLYLSLHTSDPTAGSQSTGEISYTGYSRKAVARTSGEWSCAAGAASLVNAQSFGTMTAGAGGTVTHVGIGTGSSGSGYLLYVMTVSTPRTISSGDTPIVTAGSGVTED